MLLDGADVGHSQPERTREAKSVLASAAEAALGKYHMSGKFEDLDGAGRGTAEEESLDSQSRGERAPGRKDSVSPANEGPSIWQNAMPLLGACLALLVLIVVFVLHELEEASHGSRPCSDSGCRLHGRLAFMAEWFGTGH